MNETNTIKALSVKVLAIIGFFATGALIIWLCVLAVTYAPRAFSSLASIAESVQRYHPMDEITITPESDVVNSSESFNVSWTDMHQEGSYHFTYTCTPGVALGVRDENGHNTPVACTDILTLPGTAHGIFVTITSDEVRLTDVPLHITFANPEKNISLTADTRVTVVNAMIPVTEKTEAITETSVVAPVTQTNLAPLIETKDPIPEKVTPQYPQSNPNGYVDLAVTTLGSGVFTHGVFTYTPKYDRDLRSGIRFDIKNIGTKTSDSWTFTTILPNGTLFQSPVQIPLKPMEHVEFTLGFELGADSTDLVKITNTVHSKSDTVVKNNTAIWQVVVQD